jgi:hypothetical protein
MKLIKGSSKGFFAVCSDTARQISHCIQNNELWFVGWGDETSYFDINRGNNVWEYYFKQQHTLQPIKQIVGDYTELVLLKDNSFRSTMNFIYKNFFILNDKIYSIFEPHFNFFDAHNILGVHVRRTDKFLIGKFGTTTKAAPVDLELFKKEIDQVIDNYEYVFLATDCIDTCKYMKDLYGTKLLYNKEAFRGKETQSIHDNFKEISGYKKGLDVLFDAYTLSKCKHIIRSSSNVSITSLYLNLKLTQTNLNVKYLNDDETSIL